MFASPVNVRSLKVATPPLALTPAALEPPSVAPDDVTVMRLVSVLTRLPPISSIATVTVPSPAPLVLRTGGLCVTTNLLAAPILRVIGFDDVEIKLALEKFKV